MAVQRGNAEAILGTAEKNKLEIVKTGRNFREFLKVSKINTHYTNNTLKADEGARSLPMLYKP